MAYDNLLAEMKRSHKRQKDLSDLLNKNPSNVYRMLHQKSKVTLDEAFKVRDEWFPELTIEYLFGGKHRE